MFVRNELSGQVGDVNQRLDTRLQQRDVDSINRISKLAGKLFYLYCFEHNILVNPHCRESLLVAVAQRKVPSVGKRQCCESLFFLIAFSC
jgi:hypothetical protein